MLWRHQLDFSFIVQSPSRHFGSDFGCNLTLYEYNFTHELKHQLGTVLVVGFVLVWWMKCFFSESIKWTLALNLQLHHLTTEIHFFLIYLPENVLKKFHLVKTCIIINSSVYIVCLHWPHFQKAWMQAGGVGSLNKGLSSPPGPQKYPLSRESLSPGFWQSMSDSWITTNFSQVQQPGHYTVKHIFGKTQICWMVKVTVKK